MLDSLVRVSRRVGGATDLLATDTRPVQMHSVETTQIPVAANLPKVQRQQRTAIHRTKAKLATTVRSAKQQRNAAESKQKRNPEVIADQLKPRSTSLNVNLCHKLREPLRLPLNSFTYY
jgi:hypothetical protein